MDSDARSQTGELPEDDGKSALRKRIQAIQNQADISQALKAQLIHQVMTEEYYQQSPHAHDGTMGMRPESPSGRSVRSVHSVKSARSAQSYGREQSSNRDRDSFGPLQTAFKFLAGEGGFGDEDALNIHVTEEDLKPTHVPKTAPKRDEYGVRELDVNLAYVIAQGLQPEEETEDLDENGQPVLRLGCKHYRRNVKLQCAACDRWYTAYRETSYKCPVCNKSCVNMEIQFRNLDIAIATQPMPDEYQDARAVISCNDCSAKSQTRYHWLGLKCSVCHSYNTVEHKLLHMPGGNDDEDEEEPRAATGSSDANEGAQG
ncbi:hypothetical protein N0V85_008223, partial [Neurospora sp. IMI 360204]